MTVPPHHFNDEPGESEPGGLLGELERRQDDVLNQLDDLDAKLNQVLKGLEPTSIRRPTDTESDEIATEADEVSADEPDQSFDDDDSVEDWA